VVRDQRVRASRNPQRGGHLPGGRSAGCIGGERRFKKKTDTLDRRGVRDPAMCRNRICFEEKSRVWARSV